MEIEYKNGGTQSDYKDGCIEIRAYDVSDAFKLGELFQKLALSNYEVVHGGIPGRDMRFIRVPLHFAEDVPLHFAEDV